MSRGISFVGDVYRGSQYLFSLPANYEAPIEPWAPSPLWPVNLRTTVPQGTIGMIWNTKGRSKISFYITSDAGFVVTITDGQTTLYTETVTAVNYFIYDMYGSNKNKGKLLEDGHRYFYINVAPINVITRFALRNNSAGDEREKGLIWWVGKLSTITDLTYSFYNAHQLEAFEIDSLSDCTGLREAFHYCHRLRYLGESFDTHNVTNMDSAFAACISLREIPSGFSTASAIDIDVMFEYCYNLETINGTIDVTNVTFAYEVFDQCWSLKEIPDILNFTSNYFRFGDISANTKIQSTFDLNYSGTVTLSNSSMTYSGPQFYCKNDETTVTINAPNAATLNVEVPIRAETIVVNTVATSVTVETNDVPIIDFTGCTNTNINLVLIYATNINQIILPSNFMTNLTVPCSIRFYGTYGWCFIERDMFLYMIQQLADKTLNSYDDTIMFDTNTMLDPSVTEADIALLTNKGWTLVFSA